MSIVVPTYCAASTLPQLFQRLGGAATASPRDWELIVVDDGSSDNTWSTLQELKAVCLFPVTLVRLLKNAGQHNALIAGLHSARGDYVVTMDDDLQHCPESIDDLVDELETGHDLVVAAFPEKHHSILKNFGGRFIDGIIRRLYDLPSSFQLTSFRAIRAKVACAAAETSTAHPYLTALLLAHARSVSNLELEHQPNTVRPSNYSFFRSMRLAANLIFGHSSLPFTMILGFGGITVISATAAFIWAAVSALGGSSGVPGWASTIAMIAFFNGLNLAALALLAVYVGRVHQQLAGHRRTFVIDEIDA